MIKLFCNTLCKNISFLDKVAILRCKKKNKMEIDEYHSVIVQVTMKIQWNSNQDKCTDFKKN